MEIKSVRNSASGIADQRPYSPNFTGKIVRNSEIRVIRDGIVIFESVLASLKRFKDDAKEVNKGYECGLSVERFNDLKEGDIIESFTMEAVKRKEL